MKVGQMNAGSQGFAVHLDGNHYSVDGENTQHCERLSIQRSATH
jgi:hypothetical protein